jgi:hypothetical protein
MRDATNFWLVTGTAAPVIILANAVLFGDIVKLQLDLRSTSKRSAATADQKELAKTGSIFAWITLVMSYTNLILQSLTLGIALGFFAHGADVPPVLIVIFFAVSVIFLLGGSVCSGFARHIAAGIKSASP